MIYLDTHVVVWLYVGQIDKFALTVQNLMNENELFISPIVHLELQYLYEIGRVSDGPNAIIMDLSNRIGLTICNKRFNTIISEATRVSWTRDPFDRIIVANAKLNNNILISKDEIIRKNYPFARW